MATSAVADPDEFITEDLGQAAFLVSRDLPLLRVDRTSPRSKFIFPAGAQKVAELFYLPGSNLVDARKFHFNLRELRGLARGDRR